MKIEMGKTLFRVKKINAIDKIRAVEPYIYKRDGVEMSQGIEVGDTGRIDEVVHEISNSKGGFILYRCHIHGKGLYFVTNKQIEIIG